jgi:hypothetical protein
LYLLTPLKDTLNEGVLTGLIGVSQTVENIRDVAAREVPSILHGEDVEYLHDLFGLQEDLPHLGVEGHQIGDPVSIWPGGSLDDIVPINGLRTVPLVDILIDPLKMVVEDLLVPALIQLIEKLVQLGKHQPPIVLLDDGEQLLLAVLLLLELEDTADVLYEGQLASVQLTLELEQDPPGFAG